MPKGTPVHPSKMTHKDLEELGAETALKAWEKENRYKALRLAKKMVCANHPEEFHQAYQEALNHLGSKESA